MLSIDTLSLSTLFLDTKGFENFGVYFMMIAQCHQANILIDFFFFWVNKIQSQIHSSIIRNFINWTNWNLLAHQHIEILKYSWSIENDVHSSHIHGRIHSFNSWWGPPWMLEKGAQFLHTPHTLGVFKNFTVSKVVFDLYFRNLLIII